MVPLNAKTLFNDTPSLDKLYRQTTLGIHLNLMKSKWYFFPWFSLCVSVCCFLHSFKMNCQALHQNVTDISQLHSSYIQAPPSMHIQKSHWTNQMHWKHKTFWVTTTLKPHIKIRFIIDLSTNSQFGSKQPIQNSSPFISKDSVRLSWGLFHLRFCSRPMQK